MKQQQKQAQPATVESKQQSERQQPFEDDRYPGSFFKVPGIPRPGKTSWQSS